MKQLWSIPELCAWATTLEHAAVIAVSGDADIEAAHLVTNDGARVVKALPQLFERGALSVSGFLFDEGELQPIPSNAWSVGLSVAHNQSCRAWCAGTWGLDVPSHRFWSRLKVPSVEAMKVWPPRSASSQAGLGPLDLILTDEAIGDLLRRDPAIADYIAAGKPFMSSAPEAAAEQNASYLAAERRQSEIVAEVLAAVRARFFEVVAVNPDGKRKAPAAEYWDDVRGSVSLIRGCLRGDVPHVDRPEDWQLYFERATWAAWSNPRETSATHAAFAPDDLINQSAQPPEVKAPTDAPANPSASLRTIGLDYVSAASQSLRKIEVSGETLVAQCRDCLRQLFPDGNVKGSYAELIERVEKALGKVFTKDTMRRALGRKS